MIYKNDRHNDLEIDITHTLIRSNLGIFICLEPFLYEKFPFHVWDYFKNRQKNKFNNLLKFIQKINNNIWIVLADI